MTTRPTQLLNAFHPGSEIEDPALFAGRLAQIEEIARGLHTDKACPIVYGDRGLGKSSIAIQARRIATGDVELLARQGASKWAFDADTAYVTSYLQCTDANRNVRSVLQRLINSLRVAVDWDEVPSSRVLVDQTTRKKLNAKILELETENRYERRPRQVEASLDVEERLLAAAEAITELTGHRVLLIIDELDRVRDTKGLASFIKSNTSESLRFMLVGIAQNVSDLLTDHLSLERSAIPIQVPTMSRKELELIVDRVQEWLDERDIEITFSKEATRYLADTASGYPWFVHLLGQQALLNAEEDGTSIVTADHVYRAVGTLTQNRFAQQFSDIYQMAVRDSYPRELVLRSFAKWYGRDIPTKDMYKFLRNEIRVSNPSAYKGHLCKEQHGRVLITPAYQDRGLVRFQNEMFKIYVRLRDSLYENAKTLVDTAWDERSG